LRDDLRRRFEHPRRTASQHLQTPARAGVFIASVSPAAEFFVVCVSPGETRKTTLAKHFYDA